MFTETLNDIMAKRLLSREKLSEITGANVTLIDEWLNGTKEPDERQIQKLSENLISQFLRVRQFRTLHKVRLFHCRHLIQQAEDHYQP